MSTTTETAAQLPAGENAPKLGSGISSQQLAAKTARRPRNTRSTEPAAAKPAKAPAAKPAKAAATAPAPARKVPVGPKMKCADRAVAIAEYLAGHGAGEVTREDLATAMSCSTEVVRYMCSGDGDGSKWTASALRERGYTHESAGTTITVTAVKPARRRTARK
jgi:hypothetical protein